MPYIKDYLREPFLNAMDLLPIKTEGELNYAMTLLAERYRELHGDSYSTFNAIRGAFACAGDEFYRRVVVPYEVMKLAENGDVYARRD
jgi:hypothetical protein